MSSSLEKREPMLVAAQKSLHDDLTGSLRLEAELLPDDPSRELQVHLVCLACNERLGHAPGLLKGWLACPNCGMEVSPWSIEKFSLQVIRALERSTVRGGLWHWVKRLLRLE